MNISLSRFSIFGIISSLILCSLIFSCSSPQDYKLLRTVPADATSVSTVNLGEIAKKAGLSVDGDTLSLPKFLNTFPQLSELIGQTFPDIKDIMNSASMVYSNIVNHRIVVFTLPQDPSNDIITFLFDNPDSLAPLIGYREKESRNGFDIYGSVVVRNNQCWIFSGKTRTTRLAEALQRATEKSIIDTPLGSLLTADNDLNTLISTKRTNFIPGITDLNLIAAINFTEKAIKAQIHAYDTNGKELSLHNNGYLSHISTDFEKYIPSNAVAVGALSIDKSFSLSTLTPWLMLSGLPMEQISLISQVIDALDGTIACSISPTNNNYNPYDFKNWNILLSAEIKDSAAESLLSDAFSLLSDMRMIAPGSKPTRFTVPYQGSNIGISLDDGILNISNRPVAEQPQHFTYDFSDQYLGLTMRCPNVGQICSVPSLTMGYELNVALHENSLDCTLCVTNYAGSFMASIYDIIAASGILNRYTVTQTDDSIETQPLNPENIDIEELSLSE